VPGKRSDRRWMECTRATQTKAAASHLWGSVLSLNCGISMWEAGDNRKVQTDLDPDDYAGRKRRQ